jgi:8-oxo-dGTP pyrophosphatase MutT (NUDIX family)
MRTRPSSRLLILDRRDRVLLFRFVFRDGALAGQDYWATPGGGLDPGETYEQAAIRELREETGIQVEAVDAPIATREFVLQLSNGERVMAQERFFLIRVENGALSEDGWTAQERDVMTESKWWSMEDLVESTATIWPDNLPSILEGYLRNV